jgi:hypothetical protein
VVAALALVGGVPLFLCMPPWNDVTLHDMAARSMLRGGVHYRDVFDTNLPGIDWAMAAIRAACGWRYEVLRAWDLLVVGGAATILGVWARRAGASGAAVAWYAAAVALFYPFTSEFNHCQRDVWMLLPAVVAGWMRLAQLRRAADGESHLGRRAFVEGIVWGLAVWVKPHALVPAGAIWVVSALLMRRVGIGRYAGKDLLGLLGGGLLAGAGGVAWLVATGAWPYFWDIFTRWNPEYMAGGVWHEIPDKARYAFVVFRPWSLLHLFALPVAVLNVREGLTGSRPAGWWYAPATSTHAAGARALLAALYLGWVAQAVVLQKGFDYVHVPPTLLALAVLAGQGWAVGFAYLAWFAAAAGVLAAAGAIPGGPAVISAVNRTTRYVKLEPHPLTDPAVMRLWPRCWREGSSPELRDRLGQYTDVHCGTNWEDLDAVARFLRTVTPPLRDRELTCWHDGTHPLYLMLDLEPSTRYMHYGTVFPLRGKLAELQHAVAASPQRYVVSDLRRMTYDRAEAYAPGAAGPNSLPAWLPRSQRGRFPWDQPVVFRSGRYVVHKITHTPAADGIDIPDWFHLDELGPGD